MLTEVFGATLLSGVDRAMIAPYLCHLFWTDGGGLIPPALAHETRQTRGFIVSQTPVETWHL